MHRYLNGSCLVALITLTSVVLCFTACSLAKDTPRHSADQVISIAKAFSPDCKLQVGEQRHG
jgi:hypothetical protein